MPPGWYDDPHEFGWLRYWDGTSWSRETAPRPASFVPPEPTLPYASFGERLLAYVIDALILAFPVNMVVVTVWIALNPGLEERLTKAMTGGGLDALSELMAAETGPILVSSLLMGPVWFCYEYLTLRRWSATVGMRALRLMVNSGSETRATSRSAAMRALVFGFVELTSVIPVVGPLITVAFLVDCLSMSWDPQRRTWHDRWANTTVVKLRRLAPAPTAFGAGLR